MNEISEHKKLPFLISFFVFILSCFILYLSLSYFYVKDEKLKLKVILANLEQIMTKELKLAVSGEAKKLFLFSNYQKNYQVNSKALVTVTKENTLIIDNQNFQLIVDLQDLKDFIYLVLPNYLSYKILLNDQVLAAEDIGPWQYLNLTSKIEITDVLNFQIEIFINKNSDYFQKNQSRFYKNYFILVLIAWLTDITILISYLLLKRKSNRKKERLALDVKELQSKNQALLKCLQVHQKLDQMAARLQSANKIQATEVKVKTLANDLEDYFHFNDAKVFLELNIDAESFYVCCSEADFYQFIFSLVNLIKMFMKGQSEEQKPITISFNKNQLDIEFESFTLDEEKMIYLANNVLSSVESAFLVNCSSVFKFLKEHNFEYKFNSVGTDKNKIEIKFLNKQFLNNAKILKFANKADD